MAKRRKKRASFAASLKYEIYGIVLITLSVIAISGEAAVGRSLSKLFGFLLGKHYYLLALAGIWVGLYVMVKRVWPRGWTARRSGFVLVSLIMTLWSAMASIDSSLGVLEAITPSGILTQTMNQLKELLWQAPSLDNIKVFNVDVGGGMIGALQYSVLYWLFGYYGAKFVLIIEIAIAFMLVTNRSYVEIGRSVRLFLMRAMPLLAARLSSGRKLLSIKAIPVQGAGRRGRGAAPTAEPAVQQAAVLADDGMEEPSLIPVPRKTPLFFQLFHGKSEQEYEASQEEYWSEEEALPFAGKDTPSRRTIKVRTGVHRRTDTPSDGEPGFANPPTMAGASEEGRAAGKWHDAEQGHAGEGEHAPEEAGMPRFTDFTAQAYSEDEPAYADDEAYGDVEPPLPGSFAGAEEETSSYPIPGISGGENGEAEAAWHGGEDGDPGEGPEGTGALRSAAGGAGSSASAGGRGSGEAEGGLNGAAGTAAPPQPVKKIPKPYKLPTVSLLDKPSGGGKSGNPSDYMNTARKLEATLESFGVRAKVLDVARGPAVTRYELQPDTGVKVSRIVSLTDDIALALAAKDIRMEAPIPGKSAIGIEVPNNEVSVVTLREVLETQPFQESQAKLTIAFGRDISGQPIVGNLARMPHLLVAGATGSGKSVCINGIITSLLYKAKPEEVKFLMIDPKMVELNVYNGIPHLLAPVVTDPRRASLALKKIVVEMEKRYEKFSKSGTRNIEGYNALMLSGNNPDAVLPYIVVIVDELADLMMVAAGDVEDAICRLAQMARASGIHLIIATQRPSVDVITGVIKANIPSRIAFGVSSQVDSRTILDMVGAEKLLGRGDMLFLPMGASKPIRVQGAFLSDGEVESVVGYCRGQAEAEYNEELVPEIDDSAAEGSDEFVDELFDQAVQIVLEAKQASVSLLQRRMRVGYTRAARLIDTMEAKGVVGPYEGSKPREVLMTMEQYQQRIPS
ncbi:DNA translocase FtsK [Cohnella cellulosilytica]|uniref:DNA translocase FtsK n=1 Tax=Cohnella cellulosilytica TaxID=986710 RepID=A0ABW2FJU1_9BACL